jgi:hypothetical protein
MSTLTTGAGSAFSVSSLAGAPSFVSAFFADRAGTSIFRAGNRGRTRTRVKKKHSAGQSSNVY